MEIVRGPKENGHRPAVDALFRSAASSYGPRVVGVVLSGNQDCGTAGMMSIKARGGVAVVQQPDSALFGDMPRSVIDHVAVDHVVHPLELPGLLGRLAASPAAKPREPDLEVRRMEGTEKGKPAEIVCPICSGMMTEVNAAGYAQFRCHVGHAFSLESLVAEQGEAMERALWAGARALEEGATLSRRLSAASGGSLRDRFAERARTQTEQAELLRKVLLHGARLSPHDAAAIEAAPAAERPEEPDEKS
jgi:two-component system chemotaxis response regulator CheB